MSLSIEQTKVRDILIRTAQHRLRTHRPGLISYSELWKRVTSKPWAQGYKTRVVEWISAVTSYELLHGRPPLNELVVKKGIKLPGERWKRIKRHHEQNDRVVPYDSHEEAQDACWFYWRTHDASAPIKSGGDPEDQAEEGLRQDQTISFRKRNTHLIKKRKVLDDYQCQACGFRKEINGNYIIDCHHKNPLGLTDKVRLTHVSQLMCLCPTCHRIAHTRNPPLELQEIETAC